MPAESLYRVSVVVEAVSPDDPRQSQEHPVTVVARSDGELFLRKAQAVAYMGQIQDAARAFCDPHVC
jgi:hypothetical protein